MSDRRHDHDRDPGDFFRELSIPLLAHELKGPLAVIEAGVVTALERGAEGSPARLERTLKRVLRSARRAQALVEDLLEVGRAEAGRSELTPIRPGDTVLLAALDAVEAMDGELGDRAAGLEGEPLRSALAAGGLELRIDPRAEVAVLDGDGRRLGLIVANLIRNALRFRASRVEVEVGLGERGLEVAVEDDGPGVLPADRERVFERWTQGGSEAGGSRQGHGLGLAAARILARGMGGDVTLEGERGSRFVVTVPVRATDR